MTSPVDGVTNQYTSNQTGQTGQSTSTTTSATKPLLDPQAFLQLLVAQLQYQDPSKPVDTSDFMNQTATLTQVQSMTSMTSTLTSLLAAQQAQSATAMIGKQITYTDQLGAEKHGLVSAVSLASGIATLQVTDGTGTGTVPVPLASVSEVTDPPAAA